MHDCMHGERPASTFQNDRPQCVRVQLICRLTNQCPPHLHPLLVANRLGHPQRLQLEAQGVDSQGCHRGM